MNVTITKTEKIEVDIFSLSHEQLMTFKKDLLADAILEAGLLLKAAKLSDEEDFTMPETALAFDVEDAEVFTERELLDHAITHAREIIDARDAAGDYKVPRDNGQTGVKRGRSSKYHYTYWNKTSKKWASQVTTKGDSQLTYWGDDEIQAALSVDLYLDSIGDSRRSRNYDEFPEVKALYERDN